MKTLSVFDIAPTKENPRSSEGAFLRRKDGSIILIYSRFTAGAGDEAESQIAMYVTRDNGMTWGEHRILFNTRDFEGAENIMSVSLLRMRDDAIGLFFLIRYSYADMRIHLFRSYDEGETWSAPICCLPHSGYFVTNNDRIIRTSTGRLLIPGNLHICKRDVKYAHEEDAFTYHGLGYFFHSDDDGKTWMENNDFCRSPFARSGTGLQETGVIELRPGVIMAYFRTDLGMQYAAYSHDDGDTWSPVEPLIYFTSPESPMKIERLDDGRLLAVWNPVPHFTGRSGNWDTFRSPLAAAFSCDNGKSWQDFEYLETDPDSGYSYPAVFNEGNLLILGYCAGSRADGGNANRLRIRTVLL
mgnify:CR=1 FL=1